MVAIPLLDVVLASSGSLDRSRTLASQLIDSASSDLARLQRLDSDLMPVESAGFDRETAVVMRGMYEEWARQVEILDERLTTLARRSGAIAGSHALRDAYGRIRAMLSVSLEDIEEAESDIHAGRTVSLEEVRRELQLRVY